jgi:hypothetical protein
MGRGIKSRRNLVHAGRDDLSIFDDHCAKGSAAMRKILNRQLNRFLNEFVSVHPVPCAAHIFNSPRMLI